MSEQFPTDPNQSRAKEVLERARIRQAKLIGKVAVRNRKGKIKASAMEDTYGASYETPRVSQSFRQSERERQARLKRVVHANQTPTREKVIRKIKDEYAPATKRRVAESANTAKIVAKVSGGMIGRRIDRRTARARSAFLKAEKKLTKPLSDRFDKRIAKWDARNKAIKTAKYEARYQRHVANIDPAELKARELNGELNLNRKSIVESFRAGSRQMIIGGQAHRKPIGDFFKTIPAYSPDFSYKQLAQNTIEVASSKVNEEEYMARDGVRKRKVMPLLGSDLQTSLIQDAKQDGHSREESQAALLEYDGGVSTLLWQMGYVESADSDRISSGDHFNSTVKWGYNPVGSPSHPRIGSLTAGLKFDSSNEMHRIAAASLGETGEDMMFELSIPTLPTDSRQAHKSTLDSHNAMEMRLVPSTFIQPMPEALRRLTV